MAACEDDPTPAGARDTAIIALAYTGGLRRAEIASVSNYDPSQGKLIIHGKGNKERTVYLVNGARRALGDWLEIRGNLTGRFVLPHQQRRQADPQGHDHASRLQRDAKAWRPGKRKEL